MTFNSTKKFYWATSTGWLGFVAGVFLALGTASAKGPESPATGVVDRFQGAVVETMKAGERLGFGGRWEKLEAILPSVFDFPTVARRVIGRYWSGLSAEQRVKTESVIQRLAIATLAAQFRAFNGERFEAQSERVLRSGRRRVRSRFVDDDGDVRRVDYVLESSARTPGVWRIVEVWFDGISVSRIRRAEYAQVISSRGIEALWEELEAKVFLFAESAGGRPPAR